MNNSVYRLVCHNITFSIIIVISLCGYSRLQAQDSLQSSDFASFSQWFVSGYQTINSPPLGLSYLDNIRQLPIPGDKAFIQEKAFFTEAEKRLKALAAELLTIDQQADYQAAQFEIEQHLKKLTLVKKTQFPALDNDHNTGIFYLPNGRQWYTYFLQRWLGAEVTPAEMYRFGLEQVSTAKAQMEAIRLATDLDQKVFSEHLREPVFFSTDQATIQSRFETLQAQVAERLGNQFLEYPAVPDAAIKRGENANLSQVPGYYDGQTGTFFYNLFDQPYNHRQSDWLYLHEAVPGHHFQNSIAQSRQHSALRQLFIYYGFREGWAAYAEQLGKPLGLYTSHFTEYGRWEWDIVRSVRVALDVGINYYGWTDQKALEFWRDHITDRDAIGQREIQRMRRWPAQVITYKYGAEQITQWKLSLQSQCGNDFSIRHFHDALLTSGSLPFEALKEQVFSQGDHFCNADTRHPG